MIKNIVAILNQKGGVGKTTTTINVAAYLAKKGKRVLICDIDPQGNSTSGLGIDKNKLKRTLYDMLFDESPARVILKNVSNRKIDLAPANSTLANAEIDLVPIEGRETKLRYALQTLDYDIALVDCPPSLGLLSVNALGAANHVLIPVQSEYYALEGLGQLLAVIQQVRSGLNPNLNILGVLVTMYDKRTSLSEQVHQELQQHFKDKVFKIIVPRNVKLAEAPSFGRTINEHDKWSKGARAYKALATELWERL